MSIIERIKETEMQAAEIKHQAELDVQAKLSEVEQNLKQKVKEMNDASKIEIERLNEENLQKINQLSLDKKKEDETINESYEILAAIHLNEVVDFIVGKVINS